MSHSTQTDVDLKEFLCSAVWSLSKELRCYYIHTMQSQCIRIVLTAQTILTMNHFYIMYSEIKLLRTLLMIFLFYFCFYCCLNLLWLFLSNRPTRISIMSHCHPPGEKVSTSLPLALIHQIIALLLPWLTILALEH